MTTRPACDSSPPELLDIVDLGLTQHFLASDSDSPAALLASPQCLISLSCDAQHIAFGVGERVLIQRQLGPAGKPRLVHMPDGDPALSLCWLLLSPAQSGDDKQLPILLVGSESGRLGAYSHLGTALWSAIPHDAPLLQILPHTAGPSAEVRC